MNRRIGMTAITNSTARLLDLMSFASITPKCCSLVAKYESVEKTHRPEIPALLANRSILISIQMLSRTMPRQGASCTFAPWNWRPQSAHDTDRGGMAGQHCRNVAV